MQPTDRPRFLALITGAAETYGRDVSKPLIEIYWMALRGFDFEAIERAVVAHLNNPDTGQFMPKPADLVRMIEGTTGDRASQAWAKVHRAVTHVGPYQTIAFDDALIHAVLTDMGGFSRLCDVKTEDMPFRAKEFETRYRGYAMRRELPQYLAMLTGDAEAYNRSNNHLGHIPKPVLIGDREMAKAVIAGGLDALPGITTVAQALPAPMQEIAHADGH